MESGQMASGLVAALPKDSVSHTRLPRPERAAKGLEATKVVARAGTAEGAGGRNTGSPSVLLVLILSGSGGRQDMYLQAGRV